MSQHKSPEADTSALPSTSERELLERFKGRHSGFQASESAAAIDNTNAGATKYCGD